MSPDPPFEMKGGPRFDFSVYKLPQLKQKSVTFFEQSWRYTTTTDNGVVVDVINKMFVFWLQVFVCLLVVAVATNYANGEYNIKGFLKGKLDLSLHISLIAAFSAFFHNNGNNN